MEKRLASVPAWVWLILLVAALLLPFANKAVNIDDPLFIWAAQQIQHQPGNFYGFKANWVGEEKPFGLVMFNPPGAAGYLALAGALAGWRELWLHLAFLLPAMAVACGIHRLAASYCSRPLFAAVAATLTPVFLLSASTLMCDVLMLAFWVWAMVFWERGLQKKQPANLFLSGVLAGFCILTKFNGLTLVPLLAAYTLTKTRRAGWWLAALLIPPLFLGVYEWTTHRLYGEGFLAVSANFAATNKKFASGYGLRAMIGLGFCGGCFLPILFYMPWWGRRRNLMIGFCAVAIAAALLLPQLAPLQSLLRTGSGDLDWGTLLQAVLFATAGTGLFWLALADLLERREAVSVLLFLWIVGTFIFATMINWTLNGRSLLPMLPAFGILLARRIERQTTGNARQSAVLWPLLPAAILSLFLVKADCDEADTGRAAARQLCAKYRSAEHTLWFEGHWGFQYYMQLLGGRALDFFASPLATGDVIVVPSNNSNLRDLPRDLVRLVEVLDFIPNDRWKIMNREAGAGFYSVLWGPWPFVLREGEPARFYVYEVTRPRDLAAEPMLTEAGAANAVRAVTNAPPAAADPVAAAEQAIRANPDDAEAHYQLGLLLAENSDAAAAAAQFTEVLLIHPADGPAHYQLALLSAAQPEQAIAHYHAALAAMPDSVAVLNNLAWLLATHPEARFRNGSEAVRLAEHAVELTQHNSAIPLGTLAAACAENGQFKDAITHATRAVQLARAAGDTNLLAFDQQLLELCQAGQPYHRPAPAR